MTARFGAYMKAKRLAHGLKVRELAEKIGVSHSLISMVEHNTRGVHHHLHPKWDKAIIKAMPSVSESDLRLLREADATDRAAVKAAKIRERASFHEREAAEILQDAMIAARGRRQA